MFLKYKNDTNEFIYKTNRCTDIENSLMVSKSFPVAQWKSLEGKKKVYRKTVTKRWGVVFLARTQGTRRRQS